MDKLRKKHEESLIGMFKARAQKVAKKYGKTVLPFPLDGQDRDLLADLIFTETTRFCLIEFKATENDVKSENKKALSLKLCHALPHVPIREQQHRSCHYIGWGVGNPTSDILLSVYSDEVCNSDVWPEEFFCNEIPEDATRHNSLDFLGEFFDDRCGARYKTFHSYICWLLGDADDGPNSGGVELLIEHPDDNVFKPLSFASLRSLKNWLDDNYPRPRQAVTSSFSP